MEDFNIILDFDVWCKIQREYIENKNKDVVDKIDKVIKNLEILKNQSNINTFIFLQNIESMKLEKEVLLTSNYQGFECFDENLEKLMQLITSIKTISNKYDLVSRDISMQITNFGNNDLLTLILRKQFPNYKDMNFMNINKEIISKPVLTLENRDKIRDTLLNELESTSKNNYVLTINFTKNYQWILDKLTTILSAYFLCYILSPFPPINNEINIRIGGRIKNLKGLIKELTSDKFMENFFICSVRFYLYKCEEDIATHVLINSNTLTNDKDYLNSLNENSKQIELIRKFIEQVKKTINNI